MQEIQQQDIKQETWRFTTIPLIADQVYLVIDGPTTPSRWIQMQRAHNPAGSWHTQAQITPGQHRVRYFTAENGAYLNCGNAGLTSQRMTPARVSA